MNVQFQFPWCFPHSQVTILFLSIPSISRYSSRHFLFCIFFQNTNYILCIFQMLANKSPFTSLEKWSVSMCQECGINRQLRLPSSYFVACRVSWNMRWQQPTECGKPVRPNNETHIYRASQRGHDISTKHALGAN